MTSRLPAAWPCVYGTGGACGYYPYATAGSHVYYVAAPSFVADISSAGIGDWATTTDFPDSLLTSTCFSNGTFVFCISPGNNDSYFAQIGVPSAQSIEVENPPPYSVASYLGVGGCTVCSNGVCTGAPCFGYSLDFAYVFSCASEAASSKGCTMTADSSLGYQMTIWYPSAETPYPNTNCSYWPAVGYPSPLYGWCISTGPNSFIIAGEGVPIE